jgi:hypothetical protein
VLSVVLARGRIGRAAGDRFALELVGIVDRLAVDRDRAVGVVLETGGAELALRA